MSSSNTSTQPGQTSRPLPELRPSPLDAMMSRLLSLLRRHPTGPRVGHAEDLAHGLELPREFVEALMLSAQRRGLIKTATVIKGKITWAITPLGDRLLAHHEHEAASGDD